MTKSKCKCEPLVQGRDTYPRLNVGEFIVRHSPFCGLGKGVVVPDGQFPSELACEITESWKNNDKD